MHRNYFLEDTASDFIITAVNQVAELGWKLLPFYKVDTGQTECTTTVILSHLGLKIDVALEMSRAQASRDSERAWMQPAV
jgi:hypothetical protein